MSGVLYGLVQFCEAAQTLKGISHAMAAGIEDRLRSMTGLAEMIDARVPKPGKRGLVRTGPLDPPRQSARSQNDQRPRIQCGGRTPAFATAPPRRCTWWICFCPFADVLLEPLSGLLVAS